MAGCLSCGEGGNISPENVRRWTEKLSNILLSYSARQKFHDYLESRELFQGQKVLEFWEKCDSFLAKAEKPVHHKQGWKKKGSEMKAGFSGIGTSHHAKHKAFNEEAQSIVEFADADINFDSAQMRTLYDAVQSSDKEQIIKAISDARQFAAEMLEDEEYHEYCRYLLKNQGLLKEET